jgi:Zc3h12a-like ribonuclease protein
MSYIVKHEPITLGDKLATVEPKKPGFNFGAWLRNTLYTILNFSLLTAISALSLWWFLMRPGMDRNIILVLLAALIALWLFVYRGFRATKPHYLLANDRQGFMRDLRLDAKTAIFDGSNIYHFGHDNGLDAQPLGEIAHQLRTQGYRIVCFFDANIFYTLNEHGAFLSDQQHSLAMLEDIFGLRTDEFYVVPSGVQADKYILESLKHLPISFVVTNDRYRDYAKKYPTVMKDNQWRKGVVISKNEIKLLQHRLQNPIRLN